MKIPCGFIDTHIHGCFGEDMSDHSTKGLWIWYIFPQMAGIKGTHSRPALFYGINGRLEAYQYINHPVLRNHLVEISEAVLNNKYSAYEIFGDDIIKFRSSILLFDSVSDIPVFRQIKNKYRWQ